MIEVKKSEWCQVLYQKAKDGDAQALMYLYEQMQQTFVAEHYANCHVNNKAYLSAEDLRQEMFIVMMDALRTYKEDPKATFYTYCVKAMKYRFQFLSDTSRGISYTHHFCRTRRRLLRDESDSKKQKTIRQQYHWDKVADLDDLAVQSRIDMMQTMGFTTPVEDVVETEWEYEYLNLALQKLCSKDCQVVKMKMGFEPYYEPLTFKEIAVNLGLGSPQMAAYIFNRGIERLRAICAKDIKMTA